MIVALPQQGNYETLHFSIYLKHFSTMKTVLKIGALRPPELIQKARQIVISMTGNTNFTTPSPTLANITSAANAAEAAYEAALDGGHTLKVIAHAKEKILRNALVLLAAYVESASQGDEVKILSSGMSVKAHATPPVLPGQPVIIRASAGIHSGEVQVHIQRVPHAVSYNAEVSIGDGGVWTLAGSFTKTRFILNGFTPHTTIQVRVTALGATGLGQVSDAATADVR